MVVIKTSKVDLAERISREVEYQIKRGEIPWYIECSPEAEEAMRLLMRAPVGTHLKEHDGVPVRVNKKFMGPTAFVLHLKDKGATTTEIMRDKARQAGTPPPNLIIPGGTSWPTN